LTFRVKFIAYVSHYGGVNPVTFIPYEPIDMNTSNDYKWVNAALSKVGYGAANETSANVFNKNEDYNISMLANGTYDRSFSQYVVYNPQTTNPPAPTKFPSNLSAYAFFDGPFFIHCWQSGIWSPSNMDRVTSHEAGHIFWACDEYYSETSATGCTTCAHCQSSFGPRPGNSTGVTNGNCESNCYSGYNLCMMKRNSPGLCQYTPAQIGW
jgi:hypothetical protein